MTIEITRPEVEALIQQRLRTGAFASPEDVILDALLSSAPLHVNTGIDTANLTSSESAPVRRTFHNLSDLLLNSPFAGANLSLERSQDYPRPVEIE